MNIRRFRLIVGLAALSLWSAVEAVPTQVVPEAAHVWPTTDWPVAPPEDVGLDPALLGQARDYALTAGGSGYITRAGKLVMSWGNPAQRYDLKSTTKSFGATALGLAIGDGTVGLDDGAQTHLPDIGIPPDSNAATGWLDDITILNLVTHTAGFDKAAGEVALLFQPGTVWSYSDGGANWLADILTVVYGQDLNTLMFDRVFTPLGITRGDLVWRNNRYRSDTINGIKRREFGSGISANVDAMARLGYLYLRRGIWDGQSILPGSFVVEAASPVPSVVGLPVNLPGAYFSASYHYGYLWWNNGDATLPDVPTDAYWAWGLQDSLIIVIPSLDIVATRAGSTGWRAGWNSDYTVLDPFLTRIAQAVLGPPSDRIPVAVDDFFSLPEETRLNGSVLADNGNGKDSLGDPPTRIALGQERVKHGNLSLDADGTFSYTPKPGFNGTDRFSYTITDADSQTSREATVTLLVSPVNDRPTAVDDSFSVGQDSSANRLDVLVNDTDPDVGDALTIVSVGTPSAGGMALVNDNGTPEDPTDDVIDYTPVAGFAGTETFTYRIEDSASAGNSAVVTVAVVEPTVASILPGSRSARVNAPVTAFATMINVGSIPLTGCGIAPTTPVAADFLYQMTDPATNALTGMRDTPVDLAGGASQSFMFAFTPRQAFAATDIRFDFSCDGAGVATEIPGVNTFILSASATPVADILALAATDPATPGEVVLTGTAGAFAVATANVGVAGTVDVSADTGAAVLPVTLSICQTDPASGVCTHPAVPTTGLADITIGAGETPTFGVFISSDTPIAPDPAVNRVFFKVRNQRGEVVASTSVAVSKP